MSESMHTPKPEPGALSVGARVLVRRPSEPAQTGRIVEDFAELTDTEGVGARAPPAGTFGGRTAVSVVAAD